MEVPTFIIASQFLTLVPVVLGLVQAIKMAGLSSKYAPLFSLILGVVLTVGLSTADFAAIIQGLAVGLSASGLFSGGKAMLYKEEWL